MVRGQEGIDFFQHNTELLEPSHMLDLWGTHAQRIFVELMSE